MIKKLASCIREYKKDSILTPVFVALEVVLECIIPYVIALLVNNIQRGCELGVIVKYGLVVFVMPFAALRSAFGLLLRQSFQRLCKKSAQRPFL